MKKLALFWLIVISILTIPKLVDLYSSYIESSRHNMELVVNSSFKNNFEDSTKGVARSPSDSYGWPALAAAIAAFF